MTRFLSFLIKAYQKLGRIFLPSACRFYPSCSSYTLEALQKYGVVKGLLKGLTRILRCSPLTRGGYDPLR